MGYKVLYNFISPVTGRIRCDTGKVLVGDEKGIAIPTDFPIVVLPDLVTKATYVINTKPVDTALVFPNAQYLDQMGSGGMLKFDNTANVIAIATPDTDYATVTTLKTIAAEAQGYADAAFADAIEAAKQSGIALGGASEATGAATFAKGYAASAGTSAESAADSAALAFGSAGLALGSADAAEVEAGEAHDSAVSANDRKLEAEHAAADSKNYSIISKSYLDELLGLGLSGLGNFGNVDFNGFRGTTVAPGIDEFDIATVGQVTTVSSATLKIANNLSDVADVATSRVNLGISATQYSVLVGGSSGDITSMGLGTSGQVLTSQGAGASPIWTTRGVVAALYMSGNATATSITVANTYTKVAGTTTTLYLNDFTAPTNNKFVYIGSDTITTKVSVDLSAKPILTSTLGISVYLNGAPIASANYHYQLTAGKPISLTVNAPVEFATNDYIEVFITSDDVDDVTVSNMNVIIII